MFPPGMESAGSLVAVASAAEKKGDDDNRQRQTEQKGNQPPTCVREPLCNLLSHGYLLIGPIGPVSFVINWKRFLIQFSLESTSPGINGTSWPELAHLPSGLARGRWRWLACGSSLSCRSACS